MKALQLIFLLTIVCLTATNVNSQVGIGTTTPNTGLSMAGISPALQTISINDTAVVYLPTQGTATGRFDGSIAFGNGLRKAQNSFGPEGRFNTAVGIGALYSNTTGYENTANGNMALYSNTTGRWNTANGTSALYSNTSGVRNTAIGFKVLYSNTTGYNNSANGSEALYSNTAGYNNTANGSYALNLNTTGDFNTATGYFALSSNTTGDRNTATGANSLASNTIGTSNTGVGEGALFNNISGIDNSALGAGAGTILTTGNNNIMIGRNAQASSSTVSNQVTIGNSSNNAYRMFAASWTNASDGRLKHDIEDLELGLDFVQQLRPTQYVYNNAINEETSFGFIAQEVEEVLKSYPELSKSGLVNILEEKNRLLGLKTTELLPVAIKAIQQQQAIIEAQATKMESQQNEIDSIRAELDAIKKIIRKLQAN